MIIGTNNHKLTVNLHTGDFKSVKEYNLFKAHMMDCGYSKAYFLMHRYCPKFDHMPLIKGIDIHRDVRQLIISLEGVGESFKYLIRNPAFLAKHGAHITKRITSNVSGKNKGRCQSIW